MAKFIKLITIATLLFFISHSLLAQVNVQTELKRDFRNFHHMDIELQAQDERMLARQSLDSELGLLPAYIKGGSYVFQTIHNLIVPPDTYRSWSHTGSNLLDEVQRNGLVICYFTKEITITYEVSKVLGSYYPYRVVIKDLDSGEIEFDFKSKNLKQALLISYDRSVRELVRALVIGKQLREEIAN